MTGRRFVLIVLLPLLAATGATQVALDRTPVRQLELETSQLRKSFWPGMSGPDSFWAS